MQSTLTIAERRPLSVGEIISQVLRRWYLVLLVGLIGSGTTFVLKRLFRPQYETEGSFRLTRKLDPPKVDAQIQIPTEAPPDPVALSKTLLEQAMTNKSLDAMFKAHEELFEQDLKSSEARAKALKFIRKHAVIMPRTNEVFRAIARGRSAEQAQAIANWIAKTAVAEQRKALRNSVNRLAKFTKTQASTAQSKLERHEDKMVGFLRANPSLLVRALNKDRRLTTSGPDRMRVRATQRLVNRTQLRLGKQDPQLKSLLDERARLRKELAALGNADSGGGSIAGDKLRALTAARQQLNQLQSQGLTDAHPSVKAAKRRVSQLEREIRTLRPGSKTGRTAYEQRLRSKLKNVDAKIKSKMSSKRVGASQLPALEAKWGQMLREQQLMLGRYDSLNRLAAASSLGARLGAFEDRRLALITAPAALPLKPKGLKGWMVLAAGVMGSFVLGLALALLLGAMDKRLYRADEVKRLLGMSLLARLHRQRGVGPGADDSSRKLIGWSTREEEIEVGVRTGDTGTANSSDALIGDGGVLALGPGAPSQQNALVQATPGSMVLGNLLADEDETIPLKIRTVVAKAPSSGGLFIATDPHGQGADQMRLLAGQLLEARADPLRMIVVTSWQSGVGKSTVAANLAMALAESRKKTLLIDACGGNAGLTALFSLEPDPQATLYEQLSARMAGHHEAWTLYKVAESLTIIPADRQQRPMVPMLSSQAYAELQRQMQTIFDVVIIDTIAMNSAADAVVLHQEADAVILVAGHKRTKLSGVSRLVRQIDPQKIVGVVFNEGS